MGNRTPIGALLVAAWLVGPGSSITAEARAADQQAQAGATADGPARFVAQLEKHPAEVARKRDSHGLYLMDVGRGTTTLIVDEPAPGLTHCGSARWASDGGRILFDATPGDQWAKAHLFAIAPGEASPKLTDLGLGNCPSPSPDGGRVAFLLNPGAVPGAESGIWIMNADGSGRRRLGSHGRPFWSPDGRQILIVGFSDPCRLELMDVESGKVRAVALPGREIRSVPSWVDARTLVAALDDGGGRSIALLDVADPGRAEVGKVLREGVARPSVTPTYPTFSAVSRACFFVDANPKGMAIYTVGPAGAERARRVERDGFDRFMADLALSPDGRHLIFCSDRASR